jgi:hypothetical protein
MKKSVFMINSWILYSSDMHKSHKARIKQEGNLVPNTVMSKYVGIQDVAMVITLFL